MEGHLLEGSLTWREHYETKKTVGYSFTTEQINLGVSYTPVYRHLFDDAFYADAFTGHALFRPYKNWQIGFDRIYFYQFKEFYQSTPGNKYFYWKSNRDLDITMNSNWSNKTSVSVPKEHVAYAYRIKPIFEKGIVKVDNRLDFQYGENIQSQISNYSSETITYSDSRDFLF